MPWSAQRLPEREKVDGLTRKDIHEAARCRDGRAGKSRGRRDQVCPIRHQSTCLDILPKCIDRGSEATSLEATRDSDFLELAENVSGNMIP
jgi:hypothetical protein